MTDWDALESLLLGEDDPEMEELERYAKWDGPIARYHEEQMRKTTRKYRKAFAVVLIITIAFLATYIQLMMR